MLPDRVATSQLVTSNLDLPAIVAGQVVRELGLGSHLLEDLEGAGREGLVAASQRFDSERGVPFRRYANHRVRGAIIDVLRKESTLPRRTRERLNALEGALRVNENASEELAAPAAPGTTVNALDARLAEHLANLATAIATGYVAQTVTEGEVVTPVDPGDSPEEALSRAQLRQLLVTAVGELPEQERVLLAGHYFQGQRFDEVAEQLGLSKSWASRLHSRAIGRLTKQLALRQ